jgi:hypothetical protein
MSLALFLNAAAFSPAIRPVAAFSPAARPATAFSPATRPAAAFSPAVRPAVAAARCNVAPSMNAAFLALDAVEPAVSSYVAIWTPLFETAKASGLAPDWLLHWGHAGAMATVLFAMGGYGAFLGWSTRLGNGETVYPLSLGEAARELHPKLMGAMLFFFLLGGQGGLVLLATAGEPILQSAHSSTAVIGLSLLLAQAALGVTMGGSETGRTAHAFLGTGTLATFAAHAFFGLNLGLSF